MDDEQLELKKEMQERFKQLPKVVQDAITSAELEKRLRELASAHKLHIDQWAALENEVMLALLGFEPVENLPKHIRSEVGVDDATAAAIAGDISKIVFEPIRQELERILEHPEAQEKQQSDVDVARTQMLAQKEPNADPAEPAASARDVASAAPPADEPKPKVERAPLSSAYTPGAPSHARKTIEGDPYREPIE